jgi:hypothetical protein
MKITVTLWFEQDVSCTHELASDAISVYDNLWGLAERYAKDAGAFMAIVRNHEGSHSSIISMYHQ